MRSKVSTMSTPSTTGPDTKTIELSNPIFPIDLENIILGYLDGEVEIDIKNFEQQRYTLFFQDIQFLKSNGSKVQTQALEASQSILLGNLDSLKKIITDNPHVLYARVPEVHYPYPAFSKDNEKDKKIILFKKKTLLQIAAAIGSFNYTENSSDHQGAVELISEHLPSVEITKQLREQFPDQWEKNTEERSKLSMSILRTFAETIINTEDNEIDEYSIDQAKKECKTMINQFWFSLDTMANTEAKTGPAFSPATLQQAINFYLKNHQRFGSNPIKKELFWVIGIGSFQRLCLNAHPMLKHGFLAFFDHRKCKLKNTHTIDLSKLGMNYYIHYSGQFTIHPGHLFEWQKWQKYMEKFNSWYNTRISTLKKLTSQNNLSIRKNR